MTEKRHGGRQRYRQERDEMAQRSIPELIELLASADLTTRFLAEMCLRDATST
jgi:hypothetical protein